MMDNKKQGQGFECYAPAWVDRCRQGHRKTSGDERADVGDKPQEECGNAPEDQARNSDEIEANGNDDAKASVHKRLKQKKIG